MAIIMSTGFCLFGLIRRRIFLIVSKFGRIVGLLFQQCSISCDGGKINSRFYCLKREDTYWVTGESPSFQSLLFSALHKLKSSFKMRINMENDEWLSRCFGQKRSSCFFPTLPTCLCSSAKHGKAYFNCYMFLFTSIWSR